MAHGDSAGTALRMRASGTGVARSANSARSRAGARASAERRRRPGRAPAPRRPAAPRAARRSRPSVVSGPSVKRRAPRASASVSPIASSTCEASGTPAWQADPVETAKPATSSRKSSESPSQPAKVKCALPGRRPAGSGSPRSDRAGHGAWMPCDEPVAQARRGSSGAGSAGPLAPATPRRRTRRRPRHPACRSARAAGCRRAAAARPRAARATSEGADADRSADLVRRDAERRGARRVEVDRHRAVGGDRVQVHGHAVPRGGATISATGCRVPTSLFAQSAVTRATSSPPVGERGLERVERGCGRARRPRSSRGSRPRARPSHSTLSIVAWCSAAGRGCGVSTRLDRRGCRAQNSPLMPRLTASVPPPVSTTSTASAPSDAAICSRPSSSSARAAWPCAVDRRRVADHAERGGVRARSTSGRIGEVAAWSR